MRTLFYLCIVVVISSCKERVRPEPKTLPDAVRLLLSKDLIEHLDSYDVINYGKKPPNIEGTYLMSPTSPLEAFDSDNAVLRFGIHGTDIAGYTFTFRNQSLKQPKISFSFIGAEETDKGDGRNDRTYISGNGNYFSVFSEIEGLAYRNTYSVIPTYYTALYILSGEVTPTGIKDLQGYVKLLSKEYSDEDLMPVNYSQRFKDGNGFSEKTNGGFRVDNRNKKSNTSLLCASCTENKN